MLSTKLKPFKVGGREIGGLGKHSQGSWEGEKGKVEVGKIHVSPLRSRFPSYEVVEKHFHIYLT